MAKAGDGATTSKKKTDSMPTGIYRPCPETVYEHAKVRTAAEIMAGPRRYWLECWWCGTREILAPRKLKTTGDRKPVGMTRKQAESEGFLVQ